MRSIPAVLCGLLLAGCLDPQVVPPGQINAPPPVGYRQAVAEYVRTTFYDPYSIRDAAISKPFPIAGGLTGSQTVWYVCLKSNGKNRFGAYTGMDQIPLVFEGNTISKSKSETVREAISGETICRPAVYEPFPEIEAKG